jgi:hypothetical protein
MKLLATLFLFACLLLPATSVQAQEHYTYDSVWRITLIHLKPGKANDFYVDLRKNLRPYYDELKKQGLILDYSIQIKSTTDSPEDWQVALMFQYKNYAALDDFTAKSDPISLKLYGSAEARREAIAKRAETGITVSSFLTRQVKLKDLPR